MDHVLTRIRAVLARSRVPLIVGGWAAMWLHGVRDPFLDGTDGYHDVPVDVLSHRGSGARGVIGTRLRSYQGHPPPVTEREGVLVTDPARSVIDCARWQRSYAATLAMLDAGLRHGLTSQDELVAHVRTMPRLHGVRQLRATLGWTSARAESPMESVTRWWWLACGIGWPLANPEVYDVDGTLLGRPDLLDPETGLCAEFQGAAHHAGHRERAHDAARGRGFYRAGLTTVEVWGADVATGRVGELLHRGQLDARRRRHDFVVAPGPDVGRLRVGLLADSGWGEPVSPTAPLERLFG